MLLPVRLKLSGLPQVPVYNQLVCSILTIFYSVTKKTSNYGKAVELCHDLGASLLKMDVAEEVSGRYSSN